MNPESNNAKNQESKQQLDDGSLSKVPERVNPADIDPVDLQAESVGRRSVSVVQMTVREGAEDEHLLPLSLAEQRERLDYLEGVVFDLDGVITSTANLHFLAWRDAFNPFLEDLENSEEQGDFRSFTREDYHQFVDGKPRYEGVQSFLDSRNIKLSKGQEDDDPSDDAAPMTVCRLGNVKNRIYNKMLDTEEIEVFASSVELVKQLLDEGKKVAIATSSKNRKKVLEKALDPATGRPLAELFCEEHIVDGVYSAKHGLAGKPSPDIFITAAKLAGMHPHHSVVVEDAESGVQAGKDGNFGLVVGVAREGNARALEKFGADIVETDMSDVPLGRMRRWFEEEGWRLTYRGEDVSLDPDQRAQRIRAMSQAAVNAIGNGFFCTRGATDPEPGADRLVYHATYGTHVLNELPSTMKLESEPEPRTVKNEDLVNLVNWLPITFKIEDGEWFDPTKASILHGIKRLHLDDGSVARELIVRDAKERETKVISRACVSMDDPHLAAIEYTIVPLNYKANIFIQSSVIAPEKNAGVDRYAKYDQRHLEPVDEFADGATTLLEARTTQSNITVAAATRLAVMLNGDRVGPRFRNQTEPGRVTTVFSEFVEKEEPLKVSKVVAISMSCEGAANTTNPQRFATSNPNPARTALSLVSQRQLEDFDSVYTPSAERWHELWETMDIQVEGGERLTQQLLRLNQYHLVLAASPRANIDLGLDSSIGPRGLTGETYRGHVFWDTETYILPLIGAIQPELAKQLLNYRYMRLDAAREYAAENGYKGAMYPWNSGLTGEEQTQTVKENPASHTWGPDNSRLQRHVSLSIAHAVWEYVHLTKDTQFLEEQGAEMFFEICRFWASATDKRDDNRYSIAKVMGPDEFHEKYPGAKEGGVRDNAYTNVMVSWALERVPELCSEMSEEARERIFSKIGITEEELSTWKDIRDNLRLCIDEHGIVEQFDGFFKLKTVSSEMLETAAREHHGRVDRMLKAEGKSPDDYQCAKQADTLMAPWVLGPAEARRIIEKLHGQPLPEDWLAKNYQFYLDRTAHGSTLSRLVFSEVALLAELEGEALSLFNSALASDFLNSQNTTQEGIHLGVMAGTSRLVLTRFGGLDLHGEAPSFDPSFPANWESIRFGFQFRGVQYKCEVQPDKLSLLPVVADDDVRAGVSLKVQGNTHMLKVNEVTEIELQPNLIGARSLQA